jgi:DNA excision repair protein ERCC-8
MYSAHADGSIAAWKPRTEEDAELDEEEELEKEEKEEGKKRKRGVLDDIYQGLMKKQITFGGL